MRTKIKSPRRSVLYNGEGADLPDWSHDLRSESFFQDHSGKGPQDWLRHDDVLKEEVSRALYESWRVDARDIDVRVEDGVVFLEGSVEDRSQKMEAERLAERIEGVEDVFNRLILRKPSL